MFSLVQCDLHLQCTYGRPASGCAEALTELRGLPGMALAPHLRGQDMQAAISLSVVKQLRPAAKPFEVRDTRVKGFLLRVQPSGAMTYYAEYGRGKRIAIGRADVIAPDKARERAKEVLAG